MMNLEGVIKESPLIIACYQYIRARENQLLWRHHHDGGDNLKLVNATRKAYNKLVKLSPIGRYEQ